MAVQTVWAGIEAGVTLIDTAPLYQRFASERLVGRALRERPDLAAKVTVETKVGHLPAPFDYSYDMAMTCIEGSLSGSAWRRRPLVYIHDAPSAAFERVMAPDGILAALRKLQSQAWSVTSASRRTIPTRTRSTSNPGVRDGGRPGGAELLNLRITERTLPAAENVAGMGPVIATPVEKGLLVVPAEGLDEPSPAQLLAEVLAQVGKMEEVCARHHVARRRRPRFLTRFSAVTASIPGANVPSDIETNARAAREVILTPSEN